MSDIGDQIEHGSDGPGWATTAGRLISEREMEQRRQVATLQVEISKAIETAANEHGILTTTAVALACAETAARWLRYEMKDEEGKF